MSLEPEVTPAPAGLGRWEPGRSWSPTAQAIAAAALSVALALSFRLGGPSAPLAPGLPAVPPMDDLYHAVRAVWVASGQDLLFFDPGRGERGAWCPWSPAWDFVLAGAGRLGGPAGSPGFYRAMTFVPPAAAALTAALLAAALARRRGLVAGALAGASLALAPFYVAASERGSVDHHAAEPALVLAILASTAAASSARSARDAVLAGASLGAAIALGLLVQPTLLTAAGLAVLALLLFPEPSSRFPAAAGALALLAAAAAVSLWVVAVPAGWPEDPWYLGRPHAGILLGGAAALATSATLRSRGWNGLPPVVAGVCVGIALAASIPGVLWTFLSGSRYFGGEPWLATNTEIAPLFFGTWRSPAADLMTFGLPALPAIGFAVWSVRRGGSADRTLALFAAGYAALSVSSVRFTVDAAAPLAVCGALAITGPALRSRAARAAGALLLLLPVVLAAAWNLRAEGEGTDPSTRQFTQAGTFLRDAPGPGRILGPWTWGHLLHLVSRRGVVIDGFGTMPGAIPFENALSALLATDERVTADYCASVGVRWVVLENPLRLIPPIAATTGRRADAFLRAGPTKDAPPLVTRRALASFWWRAYYDRGRARPEAGRFGRPLTGFRLAWESAERAGEPAPFDGPAVQVWELVGGRAEPGG